MGNKNHNGTCEEPNEIQEYLYSADAKMYDIAEKVLILLESSIITEEFLVSTSDSDYGRYNAGQYNAFKLIYQVLANTLDINKAELSRRINERKFLKMYGNLDNILRKPSGLLESVKTCTMLISSENGITLMSRDKEDI